ncbi:MafI family immunity protein [Streptomyces asiaticus]
MAAFLGDSPLTSEAVITDVRDLLSHGEEALAFDTMCLWIYEDALPLAWQYRARLVAPATEMGTDGTVSSFRVTLYNKDTIMQGIISAN